MSAGAKPVAEVNAVDRYGHRITVQFHWLGDRYGHTISVVRGSFRRILLESVEGDNNTFWPPSPPFQDLSESTIESDLNRGQVTMLVGAAGKSHWAMTVSPRDHWIDRKTVSFQAELFFDVACRFKVPPTWLGNSYRILAGQIAASDKLQLVRVPVDPPSCLVVPENAALRLDTSTSSSPMIRIEAAISVPESAAETIRWQYAMRLCHE